MSFDPDTLILSVILGGVGMALFVYGKKQGRIPHLLAGVAYMAYPYFVDGVLASLGIAVAIGVGLWLAVRQGY
jgi:hypothetical protein